jgi:RNA polymerase sigma factor (sigma-70 family)
MIDIVSIGNQKLTYKDHQDIKFESLSFYLNLAQKAISKFAASNANPSVKAMLKSDDAISSIANSVMMADWRWDEDRKGKTGEKKTRYSYRNQCAIWAIKSYITRKNHKKHKMFIDHNIGSKNSDNDMSLLDIFAKDNNDPINIIMQNESISLCKSKLNQILSDNIISERQKEYIKLYYFENKTFAEIGKMFNITREAVRQGIKKAFNKIRESYSDLCLI